MMKSGKTIWLLNHHAVTPEYGGGGERHYELAMELAKRGYDVTVFASSFSHTQHLYLIDEEIKVCEYLEHMRFVFLRTAPAYGNMAKRLLNYFSYYKKLKKIYKEYPKPDVIIASSVHPLAWEAGAYICRKTGARFFAEVRDLWPFSLKEHLGRIYFAVEAFFLPIEKRAYQKAEKIVTTMPYAYEYIAKLGIDPQKVVWIPHGIDIESFDRNQKDNDGNIPLNIKEVLKSGYCCIYAGAYTKSEGLEHFIKAAKIITDEGHENIKFVFIGEGTEGSTIRRMVADLHLEHVVHIFGKVPRNQVGAILSLAQICICGLIDKEAFQYGISKNKFYDYFAARKPVIFASNVRGSIIDMAKAGFTVRSENPQQIVDAVRKLYHMPEQERNVLSENGRQYLEQHHTNESVARQFEEIIQSDK